jgi:predicted SAM-dependent methyltransferase
MKLNLGSRNDQRKIPGYTTIDLAVCDIAHDLRVVPYPFADGSIDEILVSHVLEHMLRADGYAILKECYRILRPGGAIHLGVPDLDKFITCAALNDWQAVDTAKSRDFNAFIGNPTEPLDSPGRHRYMYNFEALAWMLQATGFINIKQADYSALHEPLYRQFSLYVDAQKPF